MKPLALTAAGPTSTASPGDARSNPSDTPDQLPRPPRPPRKRLDSCVSGFEQVVTVPGAHRGLIWSVQRLNVVQWQDDRTRPVWLTSSEPYEYSFWVPPAE